MLYSDASGVEHTDSGPHNSGNKSSGRMNRRSPYSKPPDAFMCGERPKKHLLLNASCRLLSMEVGPLCAILSDSDNVTAFGVADAPRVEVRAHGEKYATRTLNILQLNINGTQRKIEELTEILNVNKVYCVSTRDQA
ncbi:hypothetical protein TNCV_2212161 [Trichonephila clavipes]|nr:hypothetical protein TNCV_2212161 [Trichonephila clavipes]